jgi:ubiquinone/menaquinone biosynthesis C-methylase UbiE
MADSKPPPNERTLERDIPELQEFLQPNMSVLDVGCGPGTITIDVAKAAAPGKVVGVDSDERRIEPAREWSAQNPNVKNVSFEVRDGHDLGFPDHTFDIVYSHTAIHFFLDPITALREQARVTKPGGWVIASGVRERVWSVRHPPCPNWDRVIEARSAYTQRRNEEFKASGLSPVDYLKRQLASNPTYLVAGHGGHAGRQCPGWFVDAGFETLDVRVKAERIQYRGSEYMQFSNWDLLPVDNPTTPMEKQIAAQNDTLVSGGYVDRETIGKAKAEAVAWYSDPHAFFFNTLVFVAGRVR